MKVFYLLKQGLLMLAIFASLTVQAQTGTLSGKVLDEKGLPLPGASVAIKGTSKIVGTDPNGAFSFSGISGNVTLVANFIGYQLQEKSVTVNGNTKVDFTMAPDNQNLNEVVVIGYGTAQKKDLTGAITTVSSKDFQKGAITSPDQLITGKVAGVQITSNSGSPGAGSTIRIRGGASLNASNDPLVVIDGVPVDNNGISGAPNPLSLINPNDIETFTVLKDASSTAIYGNRGSNGVIIITTKKGQSGAPKVSFSTTNSYATPAAKADILSADEFVNFVKNANVPIATPALKGLVTGNAGTDWQDAIYQNAFTTDNNLSVSGSLKNLPYRVSAGYINQDGILKTGNLQRTSMSLNLSPTLFNNSLKVDINLKGTYNKNRYAEQGAIGAAASFDPSKPVYSNNSNYNGYWEWLDGSSVNGLRGLAPKNPLGLLEQKNDVSDVYRSIGNIQLDYRLPFLKDLRANLNLGYDVSKGTGTTTIDGNAASQFKRFADANNVLRSGSNNQYRQEKINLLSDFYLNYAKDIKSINSRIDITAGTSYQQFRSNEYSFADYSFDGVKRPNSDPLFPTDRPENRLLSYYGRAIYTLADRYTLTATLRADGSSKLSPDNRWGYFPSAAFAWRLSQESFLKNVKQLSDLKLRIGYGITGQQDGISNYSYLGNYALSNNTAQYQIGDTFYNMYRPLPYNPNLKWEQTATANIGLDFGFFNGRLNGTLDFYKKKTSDLLNVINQPAGTNFINEFVANVGNMENKGFEFALNGMVIDKKDVSLNLGFNMTRNINRITNLTAVNDPNYIGVKVNGISGGTGNTIQIHSTGFNKASFYVYKQVYDANGKPLEDVFADLNGDGQINDGDLYRYKNPDPAMYLGFTASLTYKKWTAGFVLRSNVGNYVYNNVASSTGTYRNIFNPLNYLNNGSRDVLFTNFTGAGDRYFLSDYYVKNASFLRMDNANIGYNVGRIFNNSANLRIGANVQNVFVLTKYDGVDPEIQGGVDNNFYPRPRTFVLGLNLDF